MFSLYFQALCTKCSNLYSLSKSLYDKKMDSLTVVDLVLRSISLALIKIEELDSKKDLRKLEEEANLAPVFVFLAEIFAHNKVTERECLLTAFSLHPNEDVFDRIKEIGEGLADRSHFQSGESQSKKRKMEFKTEIEDFDSICDEFVDDLKEHIKERDRVKKTVDCGILAIEGSALTHRVSYDPVTSPVDAFDLDLPPQMKSDLLIALSSTRWHMLSWVLDWPILEERCKRLIDDPEMRFPRQELKYLVIDYTQFEEWSSDEEGDVSGGIEKGYENYGESETDDNSNS